MPKTPELVIIVDDDAAVRNSLKFALETEGFQVRVYAGGAELLADDGLASGGCLVVDQHMPGMTGVELVDRLRERCVEIPAILISAKPTAQLRLGAKRIGIRLLLEKPLADGALVDGIRSALASVVLPVNRGRRPDLR